MAPSKGRRVLKRKRAEHLLSICGMTASCTQSAAPMCRPATPLAPPYTRCPHAAAVAAAAPALVVAEGVFPSCTL